MQIPKSLSSSQDKSVSCYESKPKVLTPVIKRKPVTVQATITKPIYPGNQITPKKLRHKCPAWIVLNSAYLTSTLKLNKEIIATSLNRHYYTPIYVKKKQLNF